MSLFETMKNYLTKSSDKRQSNLANSQLFTLKLIQNTTLREIANLERETSEINREISDIQRDIESTRYYFNDSPDEPVDMKLMDNMIDELQNKKTMLIEKRNALNNKLGKFREQIKEIESLISEKEKEKENETKKLNIQIPKSLETTVGRDNTANILSFLPDNVISSEMISDKSSYKGTKGGKTHKNKSKKCKTKRKYRYNL